MLPGVRSVPGQPERDGELVVRQFGTHRLGPGGRVHRGAVLLRRGAAPGRHPVAENNLPAVKANLLRLPRPPGYHDVRLDETRRTPASAQWTCREYFLMAMILQTTAAK